MNKKIILAILVVLILGGATAYFKFYSKTQLQQTVSLYYYNSKLDQDESGNIMCSRQGLVKVQRIVPLTQTPVQDAVKLLLKGELTAEERVSGITTEYPLEGFSLTGVVNNPSWPGAPSNLGMSEIA